MAKYNQKEKTKYFNNEFENMPSIDYRCLYNYERLDTENKNIVDWNVVDEICRKYGFSFALISDTFGLNYKHNYDVSCVIYKKVDITHDQYVEWRKNNEWAKIHEEQNKYTETYKKLQECIHELDEETDLVFATSNAGNCGVFGSHDVRRQSYSPIDYFSDWDFIIDTWHPSIHDTLKKLSKGVYIMIESCHLKREIVKRLRN